MKKNIFISIVTVILFTVGCDNFLDTKDYLNKNDQNFPQTEEDAGMALASLYHVLATNQESSTYYVCDMSSDDRFAGGGPNDVIAHAADQIKKANDNMREAAWTNLYRGVFRANKLLEAFDQIEFSSQDAANTILGETYFMRAVFFFELSRLFGDVPLLPTSEAINIPKTPAKETYSLIASDLKKAIELIPAVSYANMSKSRLGHATKWAAEAMLTRVFLFYTGYYNADDLPLIGSESITKSQVITWLEDCIENSGHDLVSDFRNMWPYTNSLTGDDYKYNKGRNLSWVGDDNNIETVFAIKFGTTGAWDNEDTKSYSNLVALCWSLRGQSSYANTFPFGQGWGQGTVNPVMVEQWIVDEPNDTIRRWGSVLNVKDPMEGLKYEDGGWEQMNDAGYWQKKYIGINAWTDKEAGTLKGYSTIMFGGLDDYSFSNTQDQVLIRFADVLLMHSELTQTTEGINLVRKRVKLQPVVSYSLEILQKERRYELAFEGLRYFDLLRWYGIEAGVIIDQNQNGAKVLNNRIPSTIQYDITTRIRDTRGFQQIPQTEIDLSGGVLTQNPGWESSDINL